MLRDLLVQLRSYPEPTPDWAIEAAAALAETLDARLTAALCQVNIPLVSNFLADRLAQAGEAIAEENAKSRAGAARLAASFGRVPESIRAECHVIESALAGPSEALAEQARFHDLIIVPVHVGAEARATAESLVFDAGRPVMLLPGRGALADRFDSVVVGWDGGRSAARALADALPWLRNAARVTVVVITGEKPVPGQRQLGELQRHLDLHGVSAQCVEEPAGGSDAGSALLGYCDRAGTDLLVMGAYGHSRIREFVLGGATRSVLSNPALPVLLSH